VYFCRLLVFLGFTFVICLGYRPTEYKTEKYLKLFQRKFFFFFFFAEKTTSICLVPIFSEMFLIGWPR